MKAGRIYKSFKNLIREQVASSTLIPRPAMIHNELYNYRVDEIQINYGKEIKIKPASTAGLNYVMYEL